MEHSNIIGNVEFATAYHVQLVCFRWASRRAITVISGDHEPAVDFKNPDSGILGILRAHLIDDASKSTTSHYLMSC